MSVSFTSLRRIAYRGRLLIHFLIIGTHALSYSDSREEKQACEVSAHKTGQVSLVANSMEFPKGSRK